MDLYVDIHTILYVLSVSTQTWTHTYLGKVDRRLRASEEKSVGMIWSKRELVF